MPKNPIFVGIDPGTTSAYAILDIEGNLIDAKSGKELGLNEIIMEVMKRGLPVAVGTDKSKLPELIEKFAAKIGCRKVVPSYDLKVDEKRALTKEFSFSDSHQMDALASAIFAYNHYSNLIRKIKKYARDEKKEKVLNDIIDYVIKEGISIKSAVELLEGKDEESKIVRKAIEERRFTRRDFLRLYDKASLLERELHLVRKYNSELRNSLNKLELESSALRKKAIKKESINSRKVDSLFIFKEKRIDELKNQIRIKEEEKQEIKEELEKAEKFISKLNNVYLLKKMKNLGITKYEEKKDALNILDGDILLVDDPNVYNEQTLASIKDKISIIIYKVKPTRKTLNELPFAFIFYDDIKAEEFGDFAYTKKEFIDKHVQKKEVLRDIIEDYRKSRR